MTAARALVLLLVLGAVLPGAAADARAPPALEPLDRAICRLIEDAARVNRLPVGFLTRVIWVESSFRAGVVSPVGAEGIAQFMPGTARERGLADPFDPEQAIPHAAGLLADLRRQFGSLAAAAAAYNAGAGRVAEWLQGRGFLPAQTRSYIRLVITSGAEAEAAGDAGNWPAADAVPEPAAAPSCLALTMALRAEHGGLAEGEEIGGAPWAPWGVQLAGNFSKDRALASFARARQRYAAIVGDAQPMIIGRLLRSRGTRRFYQVRLPAASRAAALALCDRIAAARGACVVTRS